jgi:tripartite-type tricarboxylate transporter receptor subunit TctC
MAHKGHVVVAAGLLGLHALACTAQDYPSKTVRILVGFAPGGGTDIMARAVGAKLSEALKQQFVVDNRPGANGNVAAKMAADSPHDGYTVLFMSVAHIMSKPVFSKLGYDIERDLTPIIPHIRAGRVLAIAVTMEKRAAVFPEIPAIAETIPGYSVSTWYGAMVPVKTSREIVTKLNQSMLQALALPDLKERLQTLGAEIVATSPEQTAQYFKSELAKYTKVAQVARIRSE